MSDLKAEWGAAERALQQTIRLAVLLVGIGAAGLFFGPMIAAFSDGGRAPGLVILTLAVSAFVGGLVWVRRLAGRHRFRLTYRSSLPLLLLMLSGCVAAIAISLALGAALGIAGGVFLAVLLPAVVRFYVALRTAVLMNFAGIEVAHQRLPWSAVQHVVLSDSPSAGDVSIGIRFRDSARLPDDVQLTNPRPVSDDAPHLEVAVPRARVRYAKLAAALRRFAPARVRIVTRTASDQVEAKVHE